MTHHLPTLGHLPLCPRRCGAGSCSGAAAGGLGSLLNLYEQVRRELERVSFEELDRMTLEIKAVIEALLKMDYELRKVHNLKLAFETRPPGAGSLG